jgi:hypothetical protein
VPWRNAAPSLAPERWGRALIASVRPAAVVLARHVALCHAPQGYVVLNRVALPVYHVNIAPEVDASFFPTLAHAAEKAFSAYEQRASVRWSRAPRAVGFVVYVRCMGC